MSFLVMGCICLANEIKFMLISIRHYSVRVSSPCVSRDKGSGHGRVEVHFMMSTESAQLILVLLGRRAEACCWIHSDGPSLALLIRGILWQGDTSTLL